MNEAEKMTITKYDLYYESRMTRMESTTESMKEDIKEIKTDLRWLLGIVIGGNAGMFALMAHGFKWF
jgi:hypothetical protein